MSEGGRRCGRIVGSLRSHSSTGGSRSVALGRTHHQSKARRGERSTRDASTLHESEASSQRGESLISANLRDQSYPNGSCDHGPFAILRPGCRYLKPATHLGVKMGPVTMTATQKAL